MFEAPIDEVAKVRAFVHRDMTQVFPDSVFVKTHNYLGDWGGHPIHNMEVTAGAIYILRNPLDVAISMTHHFGVDQDEAIKMMATPGQTIGGTEKNGHVPEVLSSWSQHVFSWTQRENPQLLVLRYEDMLAKPKSSFGKMGKFLGLKVPRARLEKAIKFSDFKTLKALEQKEGFREKSEFAQSFFREGKKDQWREKLSDAQIRQIISDHREQMARFKYIPKDFDNLSEL